MTRRMENEDVEENLQRQLYFLNEERYFSLFAARDAAQAAMDTESAYEEVTDIDEIDAYFDKLEKQQTMSGAEMFSYQGGSEWQ